MGQMSRRERPFDFDYLLYTYDQLQSRNLEVLIVGELRGRRIAASLLIVRVVAGLLLVVSAVGRVQMPLGLIAFGIACLASFASFVYERYDGDYVRVQNSLLGDYAFGALACTAFAVDGGSRWWWPILVFVLLSVVFVLVSGMVFQAYASWPGNLSAWALLTTGGIAAGLSVHRDSPILLWVVVAGMCAVAWSVAAGIRLKKL
jgi:hypothetical protein